MGDMADDARTREEERELDRLADALKNQLAPMDDFDNGSIPEPSPQDGKVVKVDDPLRPEARRGRYYLPHPETGATTSWQRTTNFVKMAEDTFHLDLWKQRNVVKGVALLAQDRRINLTQIANADVKLDKTWLNNVATGAQDAAEAYKMSDEGTALHTSTELADHGGGDLNRVPEHHRRKVRMYLDALAAHGIRIVPGMIERVLVSLKYGVAGKLDRIGEEADGTRVIVDLKTGDSLDLSMPGIAAQLECYENGVNAHGIFDGQGYDTSVKVRDDYAIVVHLPSTRDEVSLVKVDLHQGRLINECNLHIRETRRVKAKHIASVYAAPRIDPAELDAFWIERLNAAQTYEGLVDVAASAKSFRQWNSRLANQARVISADMRQAGSGMGS